MANKVVLETTPKIDRKATAKNGKDLCEQIRPVIQMRRKQTQKDVISSTSLIKVIQNASIKSRLEQVVLDRIEWEDDPVSWFVKKLQEVKEENPKEGEYLWWRYYLDMSDSEYCYTYNVTDTTLWRIKERAFVYIAIVTGYQEYCYKKTLKIE